MEYDSGKATNKCKAISGGACVAEDATDVKACCKAAKLTVQIVEGSLNFANLVLSDNDAKVVFEQAVEISLAVSLEVEEDWIEVNASTSRRLNDRRLAGVLVSYTITIPANSGVSVTAETLTTEITALGTTAKAAFVSKLNDELEDVLIVKADDLVVAVPTST